MAKDQQMNMIIKPTNNNKILKGLTFVLSGIFPEIGGGVGLNIGKEKLKKMLQSFGGRVTSSVTSKTSFLIAGKEPGYSKVFKARNMNNCKIIGLNQVIKGLIKGNKKVLKKALIINEFSPGFRGNSKALKASINDLKIASGKTIPRKKLLNKAKFAKLKEKVRAKKRKRIQTKREKNKRKKGKK